MVAGRPAAVGHARIVARLRERGHSLEEIRRATEEGRLAFGYIEELFPAVDDRVYTLKQAAAETGLEPALVERVFAALGMSSEQTEALSSEDVQLLRYVAAVLSAGLPLVAMLQLVRVYGQAMAQVADAEVRLFHLYVHEPLMRSGASGVEMSEEMLAITRELLPLASPVMDQVHQRYLQHFVEQDVVGHMETELDTDALDLGRLRVAIAFADLAGYTRLTEEEGELEAVDAVERFVEAVETTLPDDARVIKTIGDEVMIVGADPGGADRLGGRLPAAVYWQRVRPYLRADRDPLRGCAVSRRRLLRSRRQHRLARRRPLGGRRGARHAAGGGASGVTPRVRADRRGAAEGVHRVDRDLPRAPASEEGEERADLMLERGPGRGPARRRAAPVVVLLSGGRDSVSLLDLAVQDRRRRRGQRAARQLRAARRGRG